MTFTNDVKGLIIVDRWSLISYNTSSFKSKINKVKEAIFFSLSASKSENGSDCKKIKNRIFCKYKVIKIHTKALIINLSFQINDN